MKKSTILVAVCAMALIGCGSGTDRPSPTGAQAQAEEQKRQQSIDNNSAIPAEARDRIKATMNSGRH